LPAPRLVRGTQASRAPRRHVVGECRCGMISAERNLVTAVIPKAPARAARTDVGVPPSSSVAGATSVGLFIWLVGVFSTPLPTSSKAWKPRVQTASSEVRGLIDAAFAMSLLWLIARPAEFLARGPYARAVSGRLGGNDSGLGRNEHPIRATWEQPTNKFDFVRNSSKFADVSNLGCSAMRGADRTRRDCV
jgi:hypothetical protein